MSQNIAIFHCEAWREKQKNQAILHGAKASETSHEEIAKGRDLIEDFKDKRRSMN